MKDITFILLTKDRPEKLINFLNNHFFLLKKLKSNFLIIDASSSKNYKIIKKFTKKYKKIYLFRQKSKGFMQGCFESIKYVKSKYCTFLYDDDLLSLEAIKVYKNSINSKFAMGSGIVENLDETDLEKKKIFEPIKFYNYKKEDLILGYFGKKLDKVPFMPVSPICMIFESKFLYEWKKYILQFCKVSSFREYFLLKKNIGPDLIIYLLQILKHRQINLSKPFIAKFNEHKNSMSLLLGKNKLQIGYWLAKKSIFENNLISNKKLNINIYNFLYTAGIFILFKNFIFKILGKKNYYKQFQNEIDMLKNHKNAEFSLFKCINIILNKIIIKIKN